VLAAASIAWILIAFAGAQPWTFPPVILALAVCAYLLRPRVGVVPYRALDLALLCALAWILLQVVPLPPALRAVLSPNADAIDRALRFDGDVQRARPLSIDPPGTYHAIVVAAMAAAMFWTAREICTRYGPRRLLRTVAWTGLFISTVAILVHSSKPDLIYGIWSPGASARPYGPFVNRNHMATWLVMALPLVMGYVFARFADRSSGRSLVAAVDARMVWLMAAAAMIFVGIVVSLSRSAAVATLSSGIFVALAAMRRRRSRAWLAVLGTAAVFVLILVAIPRSVDLGMRFENPRLVTTTWTRQQIWRETLPIVRDFPITGTGVGTYPTAMLVYQQSDRRLFFNQAHNQYLQIAAEGGVGLVLLMLWALVAFALLAARGLRSDRTPILWVRTGAVAGIIGVFVQSIWETGLRLPANALLFAVLCALAVYDNSSAEITARQE
jgi:putative inorganic carbon (HCO3(-)) transporter